MAPIGDGSKDFSYNVFLNPRLFGTDPKKGGSKKDDDDVPPPSPPPLPPEPPRPKPPPEYEFSGLEIIVPSDGLKQNIPFEVQGTYKVISPPLTKINITVRITCFYNGKEDITWPGVNAQLDKASLTFKVPIKSCIFHDTFLRDRGKAADATFTMKAIVTGTGAKEPFTSPDVTLPMATKTIILKKGTYDKVAADKEPDKYPLDGADFVPDNKISKLQEFLISIRLLDKTLKTGYFGDSTEAAVKKFQEYAQKKERKKLGDGKIFCPKPEHKPFTGEVDGIVGKQTEDEIAVWTMYKYVAPTPEYMKGDIDDHGWQNGHSKKEFRKDPNHHEGSQIIDMQTIFAKVDAYPGAKDGWYWDKMEAAVKLFQEHAEKGQFLINGVLTDIGEKLTGHVKGVLGLGTVEMAKKVEKLGGKVVENKTVSYSGSIAHIPDKALKVLKSILKDAKISSVIITSTVRTPADQARIMYDNITTHGIEAQKKLYGTGGDKVIEEYSRLKTLKKNTQEIKQGMEDKINEVGPTTVSKHCCNPSTLSIFDVAPSSIPKGFDKAFEAAIKGAKERGEVSKYFIPPSDPAYHIEVNL